ncbi:GTP 3',8-cyclase MoaA [Paenibacillus sp. GCM10027626]|uniref:GTP 3',8-cyclase MoaA n=1 Tax=Paenibacillus sp. GCM10027626 TaxID=3273411 RepID=UPI00362D7480
MIQPVKDSLHRLMRDLRISVTDRCNFRCTYCMPKEIYHDNHAFFKKQELLSYEEIRRLAELFVSLGVKKVRLTGGEPLLRKNLNELVRQIVSIKGVEDIALTTNGLLLHQQGQELFKAGLRRINISLDALNPEIFGQMNGRGFDPAQILDNIDYATQLGFEIKVNMVIQRHINVKEIIPMTTYFKDRNLTIRLIEFMDVGNDNGWDSKQVVTKKELLQLLQKVYELEPVEPAYLGEVAQYYRYNQSAAKIGFISSISEPFCSACTRARLSAEGKLFTCLFASDGFDLRSMLRGGASNEELLEAIQRVWTERNDRYSDERSTHNTEQRKKIGMSYIGG